MLLVLEAGLFQHYIMLDIVGMSLSFSQIECVLAVSCSISCESSNRILDCNNKACYQEAALVLSSSLDILSICRRLPALCVWWLFGTVDQVPLSGLNWFWISLSLLIPSSGTLAWC